jgi:uncharacterized damage-inducible protein DinB
MKRRRHSLTPVENFSPGVGLALAAMEEVRGQLRKIVEGMSDEDLARRAVPGAHAVGALVLHIGEAEWWWMNCIVQGHELTDHDRAQAYWDVLEDPEAFAAKNYSARFCLDTIDRIRGETRSFLSALDDGALEKVYGHTHRGRRMEASLRWILHHLVDHEAQHKGQILMLKRMLGLKNESMV